MDTTPDDRHRFAHPSPAGDAPALGDRRPLASRSTGWARGLARLATRIGCTPNGISALGLLLAGLGAGCLVVVATTDSTAAWRAWLLVGAAAGVQLRLLANLLDGMVAVEGGRGTATGPLWNEVPDRLADLALLLATGWAAGGPWGIGLGVAAAIGALFTAYLRQVGGALGLPQDFCGPLAKPQRMAVLTAALLLAAATTSLDWNRPLLLIALGLIAIGTALTAIRRLRRQVRALEARS